MNNSKKFETVRKYYELNLWDERKVRDAVAKGWITTSEFQEITGNPY